MKFTAIQSYKTTDCTETPLLSVRTHLNKGWCLVIGSRIWQVFLLLLFLIEIQLRKNADVLCSVFDVHTLFMLLWLMISFDVWGDTTSAIIWKEESIYYGHKYLRCVIHCRFHWMLYMQNFISGQLNNRQVRH